jgi:integrase/recombinase XerD
LALELLLTYAAKQSGKTPSQLDIPDLNATLITAFLQHLEHDRGNSITTRNTRLAAIRSLFRYAALRHPEHAATIDRVLAIQGKRFERALVTFLTEDEVTALLAACDRSTWTGRRDHALLLLAIETGLRRSELIHLRCNDLHLDAGAHVRCLGEGRKIRTTPITTNTRATLRTWLKERAGQAHEPLFPTRRGTALSGDALERRLAVYVDRAATECATLNDKRVTLHVMRHTAAMRLLHAGVDTSVIAMWLGHEHVNTTSIYLHGDLRLKQRVLDRTKPTNVRAGRYRPTDTTLAFLDSL